jgi:hypothetical protein
LPVGASESALEALPAGLEQNETNPGVYQFRKLGHVEAEHDWKGGTEPAFVPLAYDTTPSTCSPEFQFRDSQWKTGYHTDFQRTTAGETALEALPSGVEQNGIHPNRLAPRDWDHVSPDADFKLAPNEHSIMPLSADMTPLDGNADQHNFRDTSNFTEDWRIGANPEKTIENAHSWPGSNDRDPGESRKETVVAAEQGWSTSTRVPQGRMRRGSGAPRVAPQTNGSARLKKKKAAPWCMAMMDAQRGKPTKKKKPKA